MTFGLGSLTLSAFLAASTYNLTRSSVVEEREALALDSASPNAKEVNRWIQTSVSNAEAEMQNNALRQSGLIIDGEWRPVATQFPDDPAPRRLAEEVLLTYLLILFVV
jgi:hypothetical protein